MVLLYVKGYDLNGGMPSCIITSQVLLHLGRRLITIMLVSLPSAQSCGLSRIVSSFPPWDMCHLSFTTSKSYSMATDCELLGKALGHSLEGCWAVIGAFQSDAEAIDWMLCAFTHRGVIRKSSEKQLCQCGWHQLHNSLENCFHPTHGTDKRTEHER